jgi:hypothetical protein
MQKKILFELKEALLLPKIKVIKYNISNYKMKLLDQLLLYFEWIIFKDSNY